MISNEEPFAGEEVRTSLHERGVDVRVGVKATGGARERRRGGGRARRRRPGARPTSCWWPSGRAPRTDDLGLETVGLEPGEPIEVDDQMRVNDWLYAIGDVNGRVLLTHMGKYQARIAADVILGKDDRALSEATGAARRG